jgi:hypothetical protein
MILQQVYLRIRMALFAISKSEHQVKDEQVVIPFVTDKLTYWINNIYGGLKPELVVILMQIST